MNEIESLNSSDIPHYEELLEETKKKIFSARMEVARAACREQMELYIWIGKQIVSYQEEYQWGKSAVERLSRDLIKTFPNSKIGFSPRNLWDMRRFYLEYKGLPKLRQLVADIPWGHNLIIMSKVKDPNAKEYYLKLTKDMILKREDLLLNIKNQSYEHHILAKKQNNFDQTLPENIAKQADQTFKDIYVFETLGLSKPIIEAEFETRMVAKIKDVMLELGYGFTFMGNQYRLIAPSGSETFIDILFYNRRLQALIAMEIKSGSFKPEYAGRMNYQLNLLDDLVKEPWENPSIGIILCAEKNQVDVEYTLRGIEKPVGVAKYELTKSLPKELTDKLPDPKVLEDQIRKELGEDSSYE